MSDADTHTVAVVIGTLCIVAMLGCLVGVIVPIIRAEIADKCYRAYVEGLEAGHLAERKNPGGPRFKPEWR